MVYKYIQWFGQNLTTNKHVSDVKEFMIHEGICQHKNNDGKRM